MNILLVNPPCRTPDLIPLGLGYIASVLRENGYNPSLMDLNVEKKPFAEIEKELESARCDVIGIGGLTTTYNFVKAFSALAKKVKPNVKIIAGNMVSTAHPELLLQNSRVDICVIDEGETTIIELMRELDDFPNLENVKGIVYKKDGMIVKTPPRERIKDLDSLPFPAWDLFSMETYIENPIYNEYGRRSINLSAVRGCPFQCVYCSRPFGAGIYTRSPGNVVKEIKELKSRFKIDFIGFSDDMFIVNKKWVKDLCQMMIKENLRINWGSSARVNLVDPDLLKVMKRSGCQILSYGFESASQGILDNMKKGIKVKQSEEAIRMTRKAGITIGGSFMLGMFGETEESVNETVGFIKRMGLTLHRFFYTTPYPATPLYEMAKRMNKIPQDEDAYVGSLGEMCETLIVNLTEMTDEALKDLKNKAEKKIRENFSLKIRAELLTEEVKRISVNLKKRIKTQGFMPTLSWSFEKIKERIGH